MPIGFDYYRDMPEARTAITIHALIRHQPGYAQAKRAKPAERIRWVLQAIATLPADLVQQYIPAGGIGDALQLQQYALPELTPQAARLLTIDTICRLIVVGAYQRQAKAEQARE